MKCPKCGHDVLACIETRPSGETIRRRRKCLKCGHRFSTFEISFDEYYGLKNSELFLEDVLAYVDGIMNKRKELQRNDLQRRTQNQGQR